MLALLTCLALSPPHLDEKPEVEVELLADTSHVVPGARFELGVKLTIEPEHWHVYWENPGDSGLATEIEVGAPEGFEVGATRFPAPHAFELPGDITSYGYEKEVVLFVPVRAPLAIEGPVEFAVEARWLVCKELCFLGHGEAELELPVAAEAQPSNVELFRAHRERLPRPWSELARKTAGWSGTDARPELGLAVPGAEELEFFPLSNPDFDLASGGARRDEGGLTLTLALERVDPRESALPRVRGVLRVRTEGRDRFYALDLSKE